MNMVGIRETDFTDWIGSRWCLGSQIVYQRIKPSCYQMRSRTVTDMWCDEWYLDFQWIWHLRMHRITSVIGARHKQRSPSCGFFKYCEIFF